MKLADNELAYAIQKKFLHNKTIAAYKIGASNHQSASFFSSDEIIIGGIEHNNIFLNEIPYNYDIAEVEIIYKILITSIEKKEYTLLNKFIGLECPFPYIDNAHGSKFICIADNCSAGDLIILEELQNRPLSKVKIGFNNNQTIIGNPNNLLYSCDEIVDQALEIIYKNDLPFEDEIYIASGGISETFAVKTSKSYQLEYEYKT